MSLRLAVIGTGVAGMTTAWELLQMGHRVDVFDAANGIASGASFASMGCIGTATLVAWDFAGIDPIKSGLRGKLIPPVWARSLAALSWQKQRVRMQGAPHADHVFSMATALARLNWERVHQSLHDLPQEVESALGVMTLLRDEADQQAVANGLERLKAVDVRFSQLDANAARKLENALNPDQQLVGAIHIPSDFAINGRQWLSLLKSRIQQLGGQLHMGVQVSNIGPDGTFTTTDTSTQAIRTVGFDAIVLCNAQGAIPALNHVGISYPMMVLNHCSVSAPIKEGLNAPDQVVIDAKTRTIISRTGQRIRASSGLALLPGSDPQAIFTSLYKVVDEWFPSAAQLHGSQALVQSWQASCVHTPDTLPLIGQTQLPNIWVNTAYGGRGWTLAAGGARMLASLMSGHQPPIEAHPFSPGRFT